MRDLKPNKALYTEHWLIEIATYGVLLTGEKQAHDNDEITTVLRGSEMVNVLVGGTKAGERRSLITEKHYCK